MALLGGAAGLAMGTASGVRAPVAGAAAAAEPTRSERPDGAPRRVQGRLSAPVAAVLTPAAKAGAIPVPVPDPEPSQR